MEKHPDPVAVKADGLAAGKGVSLCLTPEKAAAAVRACMSQRVFGEAGNSVVIQELLSGPEVSVFAFSDGDHLSSLVAACDYKRLNDQDRGPNTGGMGSFAPPDFWSDDLSERMRRTIMEPVLHAMSLRGSPYRGVLYAGVILTQEGPKVLEFNCRWGDPEAQVVLPLLTGDPLEIMVACHEGRLARVPVRWGSENYVGVVMVSKGYPGEYDTGFEMSGLDSEEQHTLVFQAGTRPAPDGMPGRVVTSGGRVLTAVGWGGSLAEARTRAYHRVHRIGFKGAYYRTDIAAVETRGRA